MRAWSGTIKEIANSGAALIAQATPKHYNLRSGQWLVLAVCACLSLSIILLARSLYHWRAAPWASSYQLESDDAEFVQTRIGTYVLRGPDPGDCRGYRYDNLTGEAFPDSTPCRRDMQPGNSIIESDPGRLDALRRSFVDR
jgi:hypothetical protein